MELVRVLLTLGRLGRLFGGHAVGFACPGAQVDHLAALAAKRTPLVGRCELSRAAAARARYGLHRLQNVSSKATSQSAVRGRLSSLCCAMKRMLSTYLLALISGTHGIVGSSRSLSICAVFPPSIC